MVGGGQASSASIRGGCWSGTAVLCESAYGGGLRRRGPSRIWGGLASRGGARRARRWGRWGDVSGGVRRTGEGEARRAGLELVLGGGGGVLVLEVEAAG